MADYQLSYTGEKIDEAIGKALTALQSAPVTSVNGQTGDVVIDTGGGTAGSVAWENVTGKPDTFPPDAHTHSVEDVIGLSNVATSGSYNDLTDKPTIPESYTLPTASASTLGGVKIGSGLSISDGILSAAGGGVADSVEWENVQNKPTEYTPEAHTHEKSDVTGLTDALNEKASASHSHAYTEITGAPVFAYDANTQTLAITTTVG